MNMEKNFCGRLYGVIRIVSTCVLISFSGCSESDHGNKHGLEGGVAQIHCTIDAMPSMVKDRETVKIWKVAFDLCKAIQTVVDDKVRIECIGRLTNTLCGIVVDTNHRNFSDRSKIDAFEAELSNYWSFSHWSFNVVNKECPDDMMAWDILIKGLENYRKAILAIDESATKDGAASHMNIWHKKNTIEKFNGWMRCLERIYLSRRHLMSPVQRQEVCRKIKAALGTLPPEIEKDEGNKNAERK